MNMPNYTLFLEMHTFMFLYLSRANSDDLLLG